MTNWIELTGKKTIHNGKEYYATQYSRDVLNDLCGKHCGDPCVYVERKETVCPFLFSSSASCLAATVVAFKMSSYSSITKSIFIYIISPIKS